MKLITRNQQNEILIELTSMQIFAAVMIKEIGKENFHQITESIAKIGYDVAGGKGLSYMERALNDWKKNEENERMNANA